MWERVGMKKYRPCAMDVSCHHKNDDVGDALRPIPTAGTEGRLYGADDEQS